MNNTSFIHINSRWFRLKTDPKFRQRRQSITNAMEYLIAHKYSTKLTAGNSRRSWHC